MTPMAKPYAIRKAGTRRGQPHYSLSCKLCPPGRELPLRIGYLTREAAEKLAAAHIAERHPERGSL